MDRAKTYLCQGGVDLILLAYLWSFYDNIINEIGLLVFTHSGVTLTPFYQQTAKDVHSSALERWPAHISPQHSNGWYWNCAGGRFGGILTWQLGLIHLQQACVFLVASILLYPCPGYWLLAKERHSCCTGPSWPWLARSTDGRGVFMGINVRKIRHCQKMQNVKPTKIEFQQVLFAWKQHWRCEISAPLLDLNHWPPYFMPFFKSDTLWLSYRFTCFSA